MSTAIIWVVFTTLRSSLPRPSMSTEVVMPGIITLV